MKEIIHISKGPNSNRTVILRGIIQKNNSYAILDEIKYIITTNMINMTLNRDKNDLMKLIIELEIKNESYNETLKLLEEKNWKNTVKQ